MGRVEKNYRRSLDEIALIARFAAVTLTLIAAAVFSVDFSTEGCVKHQTRDEYICEPPWDSGVDIDRYTGKSS